MDKVALPEQTWQSDLANTLVGATGFALTCYLAWRFVLRPWERNAGVRRLRVIGAAKAVDVPRARCDPGHD